MTDRAVTYGSYLAIDELLALQRPRSEGPEHDEMLFIVIHQVYELWFKEILHELDQVMRWLERGEPHRAQHTMKRILTIMKVLVAQLDILETMTPLEFQSFRDPARSRQRVPVRSVPAARVRARPESRGGALARFPEGSRAHRALVERHAARTLWDAFVHYLSREGYAVPGELLSRDVTLPIAASEALQDTLITVYRSDPKNAELCERLVDLDEGLQEWRYRHVKMVQRTIGTRPGTGGSSGAGYLATTLMQPLFPDLWAIRARL